MERELLMTGIGGQGVQLAAQLLAQAATRTRIHVQLFGSYGGMMRGGNTDATLILADEPVQSPPMISSAWSAIVMHHEYAHPTLIRVRPHGPVVVNTSVVTLPLSMPDGGEYPVQAIPVPASDLAIELGSPAAGAMVALGAYVTLTEMLALEVLVATLPEVLPPYRQQHVASNARALEAGASAATSLQSAEPAWPAQTRHDVALT